MNPRARALQDRTHAFYLRTIRLCESLPRTLAATTISKQLMEAAGGADSNYRAACRGRSTREFIAKIAVAAEEADECIGWLHTLVDVNLGAREEANALLQEANELTAIFVASEKTAKRNLAARKVDAPRSARRGK